MRVIITLFALLLILGLSLAATGCAFESAASSEGVSLDTSVDLPGSTTGELATGFGLDVGAGLPAPASEASHA